VVLEVVQVTLEDYLVEQETFLLQVLRKEMMAVVELLLEVTHLLEVAEVELVEVVNLGNLVLEEVLVVLEFIHL
jgi:hypothetical protein